MLFLAAAALVSSTAPTPPPRRTVAPLVQARATVRILSGARLQLGQRSTIEGQQLRVTTISTPEGIQRASLVEFE